MHKYPIVIFTLTSLLACSEQDKPKVARQTSSAEQVSVIRHQDPNQIQRGQQLFTQHCATCHGMNAEGAPNWSRPGADGRYPAPPLNGTGHAWHHPKQALVNTIKFGTIRLGGSMPPWQGKLSGQEIDDIIAWFQSKWPDALYTAWQRRDRASRQEK